MTKIVFSLLSAAAVACGMSGGHAAAQETPVPTASPAAPGQCPQVEHWDTAMRMCMPGAEQPKPALMLHLNQFLVSSSTTGPRGQSRLTGPGMWMLMYGADLSPRNRFRIDVMGSPEQLTVGDTGTPQLLQTENLDNMHAHDTVMALEFRDVLRLGEGDRQQLTFLVAPRGAASIGPVPFMHRESAEGNPDAPLGHALQDGFHDASTVVGVEYQNGRTTLEATAFSGQDITGPFPMHRLDSYGLRVNHAISDRITVGASFADALLPGDSGGEAHNRFVSVWLTTSSPIGGGILKSASVWGQIREAQGISLNSYLEEATFRSGKNNFYGRAEVLQFTPEQLNIAVTGALDSKWAKALTVGYERVLFEAEGKALLAGGSYTRDFVPSAFRPAYGSDPGGVKIFLRLKIDASLRGRS